LQTKINHGKFIQLTSILAQSSINPRKPRKLATHGQGYTRERKREGHQRFHGNPLLASSPPQGCGLQSKLLTPICTLL
ncbi:hypothetical protein LINPERHAP1_LOCUS21022, partial [Linum perenne]